MREKKRMRGKRKRNFLSKPYWSSIITTHHLGMKPPTKKFKQYQKSPPLELEGCCMLLLNMVAFLTHWRVSYMHHANFFN
jgi:hypothetical protein